MSKDKNSEVAKVIKEPVKKKKKTNKYFLCESSFHPEHNGKPCLCCGCLHDDSYCTPSPCAVCEGPVTDCGYGDEEN